MRTVSRFESDLLHIVQGVLRRAPAEQAAALVLRKADRPGCLSRDCVELVQDYLRKGCVSWLARSGGWHRERFLRDGTTATGRLWERTSPLQLGLPFSRHSLSFLMWLTASDPRQSAYRPRTEKAALTLGDQFLFLLAYEAFRQTEVAVTLRNQPVVSTHALIRLAFPEDFSGHLQPVDWTSWFSGDGPLLLEAMQRWLAIRCKATERHKALIISPAEMLACGQTQIDVLGRFLEAAQQNRRPDLARFVLQSLSDLLRGTPETREWTRNLNVGDLRIADRAEVYRAAAAFLRQGERLQAWTAAARGVSFFDREEYVAAQLWLTDWDRWHGDAACQTAADLVRQLDLIRMVSA